MSLIIAATVQPRHNHRSGRVVFRRMFPKKVLLLFYSCCVWVAGIIARLHQRLLRLHMIRCGRHSYDMSLLKLISVVNGACYLRSRYLYTHN